MREEAIMPKVTTGNRLYFYQLFSREIGIGQQVSLTRVEEVLATVDLEPADLEFETCADLIAALPEIFKLTVFKKGRTYATLLQNEEYDGILARLSAPAAPEKGAKGGPKTWKRKKAPKDPTPAKPHKRVVEVVPEPELKPEPEPEPVATTEPEQAPEPEVASEAAAEVEVPAEVEVVVEVASEPEPEPEPSAEAEAEPEAEPVSEVVAEATEEQPAESPEPAQHQGISLTITYDPSEDETQAPADQPAVEEPPAVIVEPPAPAPAPSFERDLPESIVDEVLMRDDQLRVLYQLLPIDADLMTTLDEDWRYARSCGLVSGTRGKVSFPLRYLHEEDESPVSVTIKRSSKNPGGKRWTLAYVDGDDGSGTSRAAAGVEGLPTADEGAWSDLAGTSRRADAPVSPMRELAQFAHIGNWETTLGTLATMAVPERWSYRGRETGIAGRYGLLREYLAVTFHRVCQEEKLLVAQNGSLAAFDTGLVTPFSESIYAVLTPRQGDIPWTINFAVAGSGELGLRLVETFDPLPQPARYLSALTDVIPDTGRMLILDTNSLLSAQLGRLPRAFLTEQLDSNSQARELLAACIEEAGDRPFTKAQLTSLTRAIKADPGLYRRMGRALQDAIELSIGRAQKNYRIAAPVYDPADNRTKLLLPLCLVDDRKADCCAVLSLMPSGAYQVSAVLSLNRAAACARIVCSEHPSWL